MSLPDEIFGPQAAPLKPLYGGNIQALDAIKSARYLLDQLEYSDGDILNVTYIDEYLRLAERLLK